MGKLKKIGGKSSYANAVLMNLSKSLIKNKRIFTTLVKGKALRRYVEPILSKSKNDSTHSRRIVFSYFQDKEPVKELFSEIAPKIASRPGGYTRVIRTGYRKGDNAETCMVELVDYNQIYSNSKSVVTAKPKTRRSSKKTKLADEKLVQKSE